ncbi:hypothetical protein OEZ86_012678 [Tetradesmus obliquus]|nr:hypothetical protein OEZ86_012678 [Tetradesmus obliquus]
MGRLAMPPGPTAQKGLILLACVLISLACLHLAEGASGSPPAQTGFIMAKLSTPYCNSNPSASPSAAAAQQGVVLSAATMQAAAAAAAAAGLTWVRQLPMDCWILLKRADGETDSAGSAAAIQALKGPGDEVMTAASNWPVFQYATPNILIPRRNPEQSRTPTTNTASHSAAEVLASSRSAGSAQMPGLPEECGSGSCTADGAWGLNRIKAVDLWKLLAAQRVMPLSKSSFTLKGTVVDDGVDFLHNNVKGQADVTNSATFTMDRNNQPAGGIAAGNNTHGTLVFGIMAANWSPYDSQSDASGLAGVVGPAHGNLASINIFGDSGFAYHFDVFNAVRHAVKANAHHVILYTSELLSNKTGDLDALYRDTFEPTCRAGGVIVVAAGSFIEHNGSFRGRDVADLYGDGTSVVYPAYTASLLPDCMLAVAATVQTVPAPSVDPLAWFSNYGQGVRIAAPGENIMTSEQSTPDNRWKTGKWDGTPLAAAHVAGAALLLRNLFPAATNKQVVDCLVTSADRTATSAFPGTGRTINGGVLNVLAAYNCLVAAALDCSAQHLQVPACVDWAAGREDKSCKASSSVFCLPITGPVANSTCTYPLRAAGITCDAAGEAGTCNGTSSDCVPSPTQCMGTPLPVKDAIWSASCRGLEPGNSCNATCWAAVDYYGPGYTTTCQADGSWSTAVGSCTKAQPRVTCYNDCKAANCDAKSGCKCDLVQGPKGVDRACTCNGQLGLKEMSFSDAQQWSSCAWNLTFPKGVRLQARRNANLTLEAQGKGRRPGSADPHLVHGSKGRQKQSKVVARRVKVDIKQVEQLCDTLLCGDSSWHIGMLAAASGLLRSVPVGLGLGVYPQHFLVMEGANFPITLGLDFCNTYGAKIFSRSWHNRQVGAELQLPVPRQYARRGQAYPQPPWYVPQHLRASWIFTARIAGHYVVHRHRCYGKRVPLESLLAAGR